MATTSSSSKSSGPVEVTFETLARGKRVYGKDGRQVAKFTDGKLATSDKDLVEVLDGLPDVRRADG